jgi:hypothetical protein
LALGAGSKKMLDELVTVYKVGYWISFAVIFIGCWIYCIDAYGFLLGVGLGWLPSLIAAGIISLLWPLIVGVVIWFFNH